MNINKEELMVCLKPLVGAIDGLRNCFQGGLESKTMHQTVEEMKVELSEINLNLEKIVKNLEQLY